MSNSTDDNDSATDEQDDAEFPSWEDADEGIREAWARGYPNEKIVKLEANGKPDTYDKAKSTGETKIDEYGDTSGFFEKITFYRIPAKALVQIGTAQKIYNLSAIFKMEEDGYSFEDISVGGSIDVVQSGQPTIAKDEAKQLIAAYFESQFPGTKVEQVKCSDPELKTQASKGRWWYSTGADIFVVEADGAKKKYSNDMTNLYKGEKGKEGVDPSGDWKVFFLDKPMTQ